MTLRKSKGRGKPQAPRQWIKDRGKELGKLVKDLAQKLGIDEPSASEIIAGKRSVQGDEILPLSDFLEWPLEDVHAKLYGHLRHSKLGSIKVIGAVEGGVAQPTAERPQEQWRSSPVGPVPAFSDFPQFGLDVLGPHANLLYPHGSVVICVRFSDLKREPRPGERVIVHHSVDDDIEATIRELKQAEDGSLWLWFLSADPRFQQPLAIDAPGVRVHALIIMAARPENVSR